MLFKTLFEMLFKHNESNEPERPPRKKGEVLYPHVMWQGFFAPVCLYLLYDDECSSHCWEHRVKESCMHYDLWSRTPEYECLRKELLNRYNKN